MTEASYASASARRTTSGPPNNVTNVLDEVTLARWAPTLPEDRSESMEKVRWINSRQPDERCTQALSDVVNVRCRCLDVALFSV